RVRHGAKHRFGLRERLGRTTSENQEHQSFVSHHHHSSACFRSPRHVGFSCPRRGCATLLLEHGFQHPHIRLGSSPPNSPLHQFPFPEHHKSRLHIRQCHCGCLKLFVDQLFPSHARVANEHRRKRGATASRPGRRTERLPPKIHAHRPNQPLGERGG